VCCFQLPRKKNPKARGLFANLPLCLLPWASAWRLPVPTLATSCLCPGHRGDVLEPLDATKNRPPSSSFPWPPFFFLVFLPVAKHARHGRRLAAPFRAALASTDELGSSATSFLLFLCEESSQNVRSRRHHRRFPRRYRATPPPNLLPPAILRPSRPHRRVPGEFPVRPDLFPRLVVHRSAAPLDHWRLPAMAMAVLATTPGRSTCGPRAPQSAGLGQVDPGYKKFCICFLSRNISEKYQNL
jgi:hypothetical protein